MINKTVPIIKTLSKAQTLHILLKYRMDHVCYYGIPQMLRDLREET